ncbi:MAG: hypothetical protein PHC86_06950 [Eubacteriales bacterium]|nr:hypothetical protein [Eubacteriales bacterium]
MADNLPNSETTSSQVLEQTSQDFKCPSCGGHQQFDPASQQLRCEQCQTTVAVPTIAKTELVEYDFESIANQDGRAFYRQIRTTRCDSCGAQVELEAFAIAVRCAFCGSAQVTDLATSPAIPPEAVVPFATNREQASKSFKKWLGRHIFAPAAVHREYLPDRLHGVYLPYWTYDTATETTYAGMAGEHYYVTESYTAIENGRSVRRSRQVQRTRWFPISGTYREYFDDVLIQGGSTLEPKNLSKIEPFDLRAAKPYQEAFLAGFGANSYSVSVREGFDLAKQSIGRAIESGIRAQVHADELRLTSQETRYFELKTKQLLLPIWTSSFRFRSKTYQFLVNGQTGRVFGQTPISVVRVGLAILLGSILALGIYQLIAFLTNS